MRGEGFSFQAPAGWTVSRDAGATAAVEGDVNRVEVRIFTLVKPYRPARFVDVARELDSVALRLAKEQPGRLVAKETVRAGGRKARSYRIEYDGKVLELTFVLKGRQEFQLLCRRAVDGPGEACSLLVESFRLL